MSESDHRDARRDYAAHSLSRAQLCDDPLAQFRDWIDTALDTGLKDATAMALATCDGDGQPSLRTVLLKHYDADGFCWYTDYRSQKGLELAANPRAALLFYWREFDRQVRINGNVEYLDAASADAYFHQRPAGSRFAAAASSQSQPVDHRSTLEERIAALRAAHPCDDVPRPEQWGGYRLLPHDFEFWQGRENRLHDRFRYTRAAAGDQWTIERLQP